MELLERLDALAQRCREAGVLVILTAHVVRADHSNAGTLPAKVAAVEEGMIDEASESAALHPAVRVDPRDIIVRKPRFSAFAGTDLELILRTRGIDTVIVAGIATDICCESTARDAADRGLRVIFLSDGTATGSGADDPHADADHAAALRRLDTYFADVVSVGDLQFG
jgi:ureidoacrylate peracid hydrolase